MRHPGAPRQEIPRTAERFARARAVLGLDHAEGADATAFVVSSGPSWGRLRPIEQYSVGEFLDEILMRPPTPGEWLLGLTNELIPERRIESPPAPVRAPPTGRRGPGDQEAVDPPEGEPNVWRVEKNGWGMYQGEYLSIKGEMQEGGRHPLPAWDSALMAAFGPSGHEPGFVYSEWRFGFCSPTQLRSWIYQDSWRQTLHDEGFRIVCYRADVLRIGDTQLMFHWPSPHRRLWTMSLLEI